MQNHPIAPICDAPKTERVGRNFKILVITAFLSLLVLILPAAALATGSATRAEMAALRLDPKNATGGTNLYSRNFGWGTNLVSLPGRAGLDLNLGISYNSLVWIKDAGHSEIVFDPDTGNVSPGFRLGLPVIEPYYYDGTKGKYVFLLVMADGRRIELRSTSTNVYDAADSSYMRLTTTGTGGFTPSVLTTTDGTKMSFVLKAGIYQCNKITDRNGNYIDLAYDTNDRLSTLTDTLGRVVTINRDTGGYPTSITQTWKDSNGSGSTQRTRGHRSRTQT